MSKKMSVVCENQTFDIEDFNGTIYLFRTSTAKDFRGQTVLPQKETLLSLDPKEASYLAAAIRTVLGEGTPLKPIERVATPEETAATDESSDTDS